MHNGSTIVLYLNIVGSCWFGSWDCSDEVVREPAISGTPIYIVGDEVDGFLGNDMRAGHWDSLKIGGIIKAAGIEDVWGPIFGLSLCW